MYASVRTGKLKGASVGGAQKHNRREMDCPYADPNGITKKLLGGNFTYQELLDRRIDDTGAKLRSDGVGLQELVMISSPEYFRPTEPDKWGAYEEEKLNPWVDATVAHLKEKFGSNLVAVDLHLDEATPHIHAVVTPIVEKEKKRRRTKAQIEAGEPASTYKTAVFDAATMFNKAACADLQTDYAAAVAHLGLKRGEAKSEATHVSIKEYHAQVMETAKAREMTATAKDAISRTAKVDKALKRREGQLNKKTEITEKALERRSADLAAKEQRIDEIIAQRVSELTERYKAAYAKMKTKLESRFGRDAGRSFDLD